MRNSRPYCASKASVISLTQAAAREFAKHKITVNAFAPGVVVTPLWDGLEQDMIDKGVIKQKGEFIESFSSSILLGFPSKPRDIAGVAAFLASAGFRLHDRAGHHGGRRHGPGVTARTHGGSQKRRHRCILVRETRVYWSLRLASDSGGWRTSDPDDHRGARRCFASAPPKYSF